METDNLMKFLIYINDKKLVESNGDEVTGESIGECKGILTKRGYTLNEIEMAVFDAVEV